MENLEKINGNQEPNNAQKEASEFNDFSENDEEKISDYFNEIAKKYNRMKSADDSLVRLDQEKIIADKLQEHTPILIRGNWRIGKTSMLYSLEKHHFGKENSIFIDASTYTVSRDSSLEDFQKEFGARNVAEFIANKEFKNIEYKEKNEKEKEIRKEIKESQKPPLEFLNDYLVSKNEKIFLSLDEVIGFKEQPEKLKYLADLKNLSNIQLAIVLHRIASAEDMFKDIFTGYETYFIKSLSLDETKTLIRKPLEGTRVNFEDSAIEKIMNFTGGRPMEINDFCWTLMEKFSENKNHKFTYTAEDIEKLTQKVLSGNYESFMRELDNYKQVYERSINNEEKEIIDKLAIENEIPISEIDAKKIQPLIDTTFVKKEEEKGVYKINGDLFKNIVSTFFNY